MAARSDGSDFPAADVAAPVPRRRQPGPASRDGLPGKPFDVESKQCIRCCSVIFETRQETVMSEADRSHLYAWMRANADETCAEYLMSCLPSAPQPDLATKDFVAAELSKCATKDDLDALETKLEHKMDAGFENGAKERADGFEHAAKERAADREVADKRHKRMRAAAVLVAVEIAAAEAGWLRWLNDIAASPF